MTIEVRHRKVSQLPDQADASQVLPSDWNDTHLIEMEGGNKVLGRAEVDEGEAEEIDFHRVASSLVFTTISALRNATEEDFGGGYAYVVSYYPAAQYSDGIRKGGGWFYYDVTESGADNGVTIIVDADGRRWKLQHGGTITTGQAGCKVDGATDDLTAWNALLTMLNTNTSGIYKVVLERGVMMLSNNPNAITGDNLQFEGVGFQSSHMRFLSTTTDKGGFFTLGASGGNPCNDVAIRNIGFYNDDNEQTLTGTDAAIDLVRVAGVTIEGCFFNDVARWLRFGRDAADSQARKVTLQNNAIEPNLKAGVPLIHIISATGATFSANRFNQTGRGKRYGLHYDTQTANFAVGETVTGGTSGATGVVVKDVDSGTSGTLWISTLTGVFQNNETITGGTSGGSALANLPDGLKALAYDARVIHFQSGDLGDGIDNVRLIDNEMNWNAADLDHLIEIDPTAKGVSNLNFIGNVLDGGSVATFWVRLDSGAGGTANQRLHNLMITGNRITSNGSGSVAPAGVTMKVTQDSENLLDGIVITGNVLLGRGVWLATRGGGAADGFVTATISGNEIVNAQDPAQPFHSDGGTVITTATGGLTITGNTVTHQAEDNTYRFSKFLTTTTTSPRDIVCTGNNIAEISSADAFDFSSLGNGDIMQTVVRNNGGKPDPAVREAATTDATVTTLGQQALANDHVYLVTAFVAARQDATDFAAYKIEAVYNVSGGTATISTPILTVIHESAGASTWTATLDASSATARVRVTGAIGDNITWGLVRFDVQIIG